MFVQCLPLNSVSHHLQISRFGVIPKKHRADKWHLIVNLSSPVGFSVNDATSQELCSVTYISIEHAIELVQAVGWGSRLAKLDLKEAYRAVPVHPTGQCLLGVG